MRRLAIVTLLVAAACIHRARPFDEHYSASRWSEASAAFLADSGLANDERALYRAALLYGTPGRPTYQPERADTLLRRLLSRYPNTRFRAEASEQLAVVSALVRERESVASRTTAIERRIQELTTATDGLRRRLDSLSVTADSLRRHTARLEADLRDRDEQLRAARLELQRLKEIDLKSPRKPPVG